MAPLAECKWSDCQAELTAEGVRKASGISKAPNYVALVIVCPSCSRVGQYVVALDVWQSVQGTVVTEEERVVAAALVELAAVDGPDDLIALWASLKAPPLRDGHEGKCMCRDCWKKRYA